MAGEEAIHHYNMQFRLDFVDINVLLSSMVISNYTSSWLQPVKNTVKRCFPNLAEAVTGIKNEMRCDSGLKTEIKNNFYKGLALDIAEGLLWLLPRKLGLNFLHETKFITKNDIHEVKSLTKTLPREIAALWGGWCDAKLFRALYKANRRQVLRKIDAPIVEEENSGVIAKTMQATKDIQAGLKADRVLRTKFIALAATEMLLDVVDARMGLSRNFPGLVASLLVSQIVAVKELDWTAKALKLGIEASQNKDQSPDLVDLPIVRFMDIVGMKRQAHAISIGINSSPVLKTKLDKSNQFIRMGVGAVIFSVMNYATKVISGESDKRDIAMVGIAGALGGSLSAYGLISETVELGTAYILGRRKFVCNYD